MQKMKKLLGIVVLGFLLSYNAYSEEEKKTVLDFNEGLTRLTGNEWGGEILILGPGTRKGGMDRWGNRIKFVESGEPQKIFCNKFGLKPEPFSFKNNMKKSSVNLNKTKYSTDYTGDAYNPWTKTLKKKYTINKDKYSQRVLAFTISKFECKNNKPKPSEINTEIVVEIEKLKSLYEEGTLTKEQFEKAKNKLLN